MISNAKIKSLEHEAKARSAYAKGKTPKMMTTSFTRDSYLMNDQGRNGTPPTGQDKGGGKATGKGTQDPWNPENQEGCWGKYKRGKGQEGDQGKAAKMPRREHGPDKGKWDHAKGTAKGDANIAQDKGKGKKVW